MGSKADQPGSNSGQCLKSYVSQPATVTANHPSGGSILAPPFAQEPPAEEKEGVILILVLGIGWNSESALFGLGLELPQPDDRVPWSSVLPLTGHFLLGAYMRMRLLIVQSHCDTSYKFVTSTY